jgi:hypothetical protein
VVLPSCHRDSQGEGNFLFMMKSATVILTDIDPQSIIWCREELLARKEEINVAVAKEQ